MTGPDAAGLLPDNKLSRDAHARPHPGRSIFALGFVLVVSAFAGFISHAPTRAGARAAALREFDVNVTATVYDDPYWVNGQALDDNPDDDDVAANHERHVAEAEAAKKAAEKAAHNPGIKLYLEIAAIVLVVFICVYKGRVYLCGGTRRRVDENAQPLLK